MDQHTGRPSPTGDTGTPGGPEMYEPDADGVLQPVTSGPRGGHGRRVAGRTGASLPGAIAGTFLVVAIAFGASGGFTPTSDRSGADGAGGTGGSGAQDAGSPDGSGGTDGSLLGHLGGDGGEDGGDGPDAEEPKPTSTSDTEEPKESEEPEETAEPTEKPEPTDAPRPRVEPLELALAIKEDAVRVDWSACEVDGFRAYKVIRSTDEVIPWPAGEHDKVVAVIEDAGKTAFLDGSAPAGRKVFYRVVALGGWNGETVVRCMSRVKGIATPEPEPTPTPKPAMNLVLAIKEGAVFIDWSMCERDGFAVYKVVRSTDSTITWPKGANDTVVAAVENQELTKAWDEHAPAGKKVFYRVFCLAHNGDGYKVLAATPVRGIETPDAGPAPEPYLLDFGIGLGDEGVVLEWETCSSPEFLYYKVVRSQFSNPSYLPRTEGSEVIAVFENRSAGRFVDTNVEAGDHWFYRVQAIGWWNGQKVVLGQTTVKEITVE